MFQLFVQNFVVVRNNKENAILLKVYRAILVKNGHFLVTCHWKIEEEDVTAQLECFALTICKSVS